VQLRLFQRLAPPVHLHARANVLRRVRGHVHFAAAFAEDDSGEELHGFLRGRLAVRAAVGERRVHAVPQVLGNDRLDGMEHPFGLGFEVPALFVAEALRVVHAMAAGRRRVREEPVHGGGGELREPISSRSQVAIAASIV